MVNHGTGPLPNLKVLLMEAPSTHSCLTLLHLACTVLHSSAPWPMQPELSFTHFTFIYFMFTVLQMQVITRDCPNGRSLSMREVHQLVQP